jgi:hypothetical protein
MLMNRWLSCEKSSRFGFRKIEQFELKAIRKGFSEITER